MPTPSAVNQCSYPPQGSSVCSGLQLDPQQNTYAGVCVSLTNVTIHEMIESERINWAQLSDLEDVQSHNDFSVACYQKDDGKNAYLQSY